MAYLGYGVPFYFAAGLCGLDALLRFICVGKPRVLRAGEFGAKLFGLENDDGTPVANAPGSEAKETTALLADSSVVVNDAEKVVEPSDLPAPATRLGFFQQLGRLVSQPVAVPLLLMTMFGGFVITGFEILFPLHMSRTWHATPAEIGGVFGIVNVTFGVFGAIGGWLSDKYKKRLLVVVLGQLVFGASMFLTALTNSFGTSMAISVRALSSMDN